MSRKPRFSPIARAMIASAALAVPLSGVEARPVGWTFHLGWFRAGLIRTPPFGLDATSPGDPRDGSDYRAVEVPGGRIAYAGVDRR